MHSIPCNITYTFLCLYFAFFMQGRAYSTQNSDLQPVLQRNLRNLISFCSLLTSASSSLLNAPQSSLKLDSLNRSPDIPRSIPSLTLASFHERIEFQLCCIDCQTKERKRGLEVKRGRSGGSRESKGKPRHINKARGQQEKLETLQIGRAHV